jgi:Glu-tRNA(Gln) amidotransferase subunit E-like FAD-binding protein
MKVKLSIGQTPWTGYLNIDPAPQSTSNKIDDYKIVAGDIRNIDAFVEDAECQELIVQGAIDYVPIRLVVDVLHHWIKKLRHKGIITITGTNLESLFKLYLNGQLTTLDINQLLYGVCEHPWTYKSSCICLEEVDEVFRKAGLNIIRKKIEESSFTIVGQRP